MPDKLSPLAAELLLETIDRGQFPTFTVGSDSMAPLLRRDDQVQLGPVSIETLQEGDVIVLGPVDDLLTHRFWGLKHFTGRTHLITRGDRLAYYDPLTPADQLRAIVVGRRRSGRALALDCGKGAWLGRRLQCLAGLEARLMRLTLPSDDSQGAPLERISLARKLVRRVLYTLAVLLDWLVDHLPG